MIERPVAAFYACVQNKVQSQAAWLDSTNPLEWLAEICSHMGMIATRYIAHGSAHTSSIRDAIVETAALIVGFNEWLKPRSYAARGLEINWTKINTPEKSAEPLEYYALIVEEVGRFVATSNVLHLANAYAWCATLWELLTPTPCES
ncbi:MAG: hypothetical protein ACKO0Z_20920 [Betaproteobacteria bacterium]